MNIKKNTFILTFLLLAFLQTASMHAFPIHRLDGFYFENPAMLNRVKHWEFIAGDDYADIRLVFKGTSGGGTGKAHSNTYNHFPYGQIAHRFSEKLVIGVAYLQNPNFVHFNWGRDSIVRFASTKTVINSYRVATRFSYQVCPSLALGFAIDVQRWYNTQLNFVVPNLGNVVNRYHSKIHLAYEFGAFYVVNPKTFLNAGIYVTQPRIIGKGTSKSQSGLKTRSSTELVDCFEIYGQIIHVLCDKLTIAGKINWSNWHMQKRLPLNNTVVGDLLVPTHWYNVWQFELAGQYHLTDKWTLIAGGQFITNYFPTKYNITGFPGANIFGEMGGFAYQVNTCLNAQLLYVHQFVTRSSKVSGAMGTNGRIFGHVNAALLKLTYAW